MNLRILPAVVLSTLTAVSLFGQTGQVGGPVIGFIYDSSVSALRPVLGIPGASTLGDPLHAGFALSSAVVAPRQDSAIAIAGDGSLHLLGLGSGIVEIRCAACPSFADAAIYSPSGSAVALYSAGRVQIVTGLPASPAAGAGFEVGSTAIRGATRGRDLPPPMALSDDGAWLLVSTRKAVDLFSANGGPRQLLGTGPYALVAFATGSHDAAVADINGAGLLLIHDVAGASNQQTLTAPGDMRLVRAVAFSADGGRLLVASPAGQYVAVIDIASGSGTVAACNCAPSGLIPMGNVMRLNEAGNGPLWLLDAGGTADPRLVFVPAAAAQ